MRSSPRCAPMLWVVVFWPLQSFWWIINQSWAIRTRTRSVLLELFLLLFTSLVTKLTEYNTLSSYICDRNSWSISGKEELKTQNFIIFVRIMIKTVIQREIIQSPIPSYFTFTASFQILHIFSHFATNISTANI